MRQAHDVGVAAQRARDELAPELMLEVLARGEPTLEPMAVFATQVKNDHVISRLFARCQLGSDSKNRFRFRQLL
jgi:hypothetical protein